MKAFERAMVLGGAPRREVAEFQRACARDTRGGFWRWQLASLESRAREGYVPPYSFAALYAVLGDKDRAFLWLDRAHGERSSSMAQIRFDWMLDSLRSDPRYAELVRRVRLPEPRAENLTSRRQGSS